MTLTIIITISILLLLAYFFDLTSRKSGIPSVLLLLALGFVARQINAQLKIAIPDLGSSLPVLGTIGLILIVLEGALELKLSRSKLTLIGNAALISSLQLILLSLCFGFAFQLYMGGSFLSALANAIPFSIVSSAIAIPSAGHLSLHQREFITYESSISDILGVILFNFITFKSGIGNASIGHFFLELLIMLIISFASTLVLSILISKVKHRVKYIPIILLILLIYSISKIYHLPALIFILFFGLFIGNIDKLSFIAPHVNIHSDKFEKEVKKFMEINSEMVFLVRSLFFILFGYLIEVSDLINSKTLIWAIFITSIIFTLRMIVLRLYPHARNVLTFIAPRGLITILLILTIPIEMTLPLIGRSLIIQIIVITAMVMTYGLVMERRSSKEQQSAPPAVNKSE